jgi:hypothetical protein
MLERAVILHCFISSFFGSVASGSFGVSDEFTMIKCNSMHALSLPLGEILQGERKKASKVYITPFGFLFHLFWDEMR